MTIDPSLLLLVSALAGPVVAYYVAHRQFSGRIETSDATDLWEESRAIREWSKERIETLNNLVEHLEDRVDALEQENSSLRSELSSQGTELIKARRRIVELGGIVNGD